MELDSCNREYWEFVRNLRNDRRVSEGFIESIHITPEMQESYMKTHSKYYRIALLDKKPCGFVGVLDDDIRICTHPSFQRKGVGKFMLNEIMKIFPKAYGKVKVSNEISKNLFLSSGFKQEFTIFTRYEK